MKFTCTQENFARGLGVVSRITSKNVALPILNNVLIIAGQGAVRLQTTNLELGITTTVRAKVEVEGQYTVQSRLLSDFVNFLGDEKIAVELTDRGLIITSGHSRTVIKGLPADEFPVLPSTATSLETTMPANILHQALEGVAFTAANDEARPEISGVLFHFTLEHLIVAATDSYRLAERRLQPLKPVKLDQQFIIPGRTVQEVMRLLPKTEMAVTIRCGENQSVFVFDDVEIVSRLVDGHYPDYQQIIPRQWQTKVTAPKDDLVNNIRAASLFCKPGINDLTTVVKPSDQTLILSAANTQLGEHEATLHPTIEGEERSIVFNYRYLLEGVTSLHGDEITIELTDNNAPGLLRGSGQPDDFYLLMPIRQ